MNGMRKAGVGFPGRTAQIPVFAVVVLVLAVFALVMEGCGKKSERKVETEGTESRTLTIKGSDTMLPLLTALAEEYQKIHVDAQVSVTGGGSALGIAALLDGATDLCMSSRGLNEEETKRADYRQTAPQDVVIARDGVAVVVHPLNPVSDLTIGQLRQIFNGKIKNWTAVGGPDQAIRAISQDSDSETAAFFQERVLQGERYKHGIQLAASSAAVVQSVSRELWSIGYASYVFTQGTEMKIIGLKKDSTSPALLPAPETLLDGSYALERPLHLYAGKKLDSLTLDFLEFVLSVRGQRIVEETGFVPVGPR